MRKLLIILCITVVSQTASAQFQFGTFIGVSNYYGDLTDKFFNRPQPAAGLTVNYQLSDKFLVRSGLTLSKIQGSDQYGGSDFLAFNRNLEFKSTLKEVSLGAEYSLLSYSVSNWSPYTFAGVALFNFNPYVTNNTGEKIYLQPLGTEGQGLPGYEKPYKLTDFALPFGAGIKLSFSETMQVGFEIGYRKTFTDYIDDLSTNYADINDLQAGKNHLAVDLAYRADENPLARSSYPAKGEMRGNPKKMDSYYFTGIHLIHSFSSGDSRMDRKTGEFKCPKVNW